MNRFLKYLLAIPFLLFTGFCIAQNQNLLTNFLTVENGLSHNEVTSIVQDNDGFIWIGTRGGLNRYDGYKFKIFNQIHGDSNSLVNPSIERLFVDSKGIIWIGTKSGGVSSYNPVTGIFRNFAHNYKTQNKHLTDNRVLAFNEDNEGNIWMGTWENGLIVYNPDTDSSKQFSTPRRINSIIKTSDGNMWIGSFSGIHCYNTTSKSFKHYSSVGSCQELVYDEKNSALWMIQGDFNGFRKFDLRTHELRKFTMPASVSKLNFGNQPYESILIDSKDRIWLGTWGTGLYTFSRKDESFSRFPIYPENRGSTNKDYDAILETFEDRDGNIWLGTNGGGVCVLTEKLKFNSAGFHPEPFKGLHNTRIMSVVDDNNGNLWLGTIGSGLIWSPDKNNYYPVEYPETVDKSRFFTIKSLFQEKSGKIWAGTGNRTFEIETENGVPKMILAKSEYPNGVFDRMIVSFLDARDMLWLGSLQQGLFLLDKKNNYKFLKQITQQSSKNGSQKSNRISYLLNDTKGRIWAGTYNGLHVFNAIDSSLVIAEDYYTINGEISGNIITCLDEDNEGNIWIGTPNGLNKLFDSGEGKFNIQIFTEKNGLASNFIKGISHDSNGNIWMSTNVGISKLATNNENLVVNFDKTDGVLGNNFTEASVFKNENTGEIFFGGSHGVTWFNPHEIRERTNSPSIVFTGLKVLNKKVEQIQTKRNKKEISNTITHTKRIELAYLQNNFEIEFSALDFKSFGRNFYKYKLENHDARWNHIGTRNFVNFNNLKPGEYTLLVKAANRHRMWNEEPGRLSIRINPPFWQTWYALVFYILVVTGIVSIIRWNGIKQVRLANSLEMEKLQHEQDQKLNEMKLRFFTNLSHEFRTPLTLILAPIKELLKRKEEYNISGEAENKIGIIRNNSVRLMKMVNQLLDFRKVESGSMKLFASETNIYEFVSEVCHPFIELAQINNISFKVNSEFNNQKIWIDRDKLEITINNLISNSFKYIKSNGKIEIGLFEEEDVILLSVSDNGPGIPGTEIQNIFDRFYRVGSEKSYGSTGIGLALAKRFIELHKGTISLTSEPNVNTEFVVTLQKGIKHLSPNEIVEIGKEDKTRSPKEQILHGILSNRAKSIDKSDELILVVEDNEEIRNYLVNILEAYYTVDIADNGLTAFNKVNKKIPTLIISDIMMPEMDGFELCKKIKEKESTSMIPFIFLTAKADEQYRLLGTQLGADDFISKPFDPNLLLEKVKNILKSRRKLQKQYSKSVRLEPSDIEITNTEEVFIEKIISVIEENLQNHKFSSDVLASHMNMSNSSLYRKLKALTGTSTAEFIRSIRIKRAGQLLADRERTITEIAYEVGFNDVKHFRTVFQKHFSCSPSEYREKL